MACKLNKPAYEKLIAEDVEWLLQQPRTLERDHIIMIVKDSVNWYYPKRPYEDAMSRSIREQIE